MASELEKLVEHLKKMHGIDLADVLRGTHAECAMRVASFTNETLEIALKLKLHAEKKLVNNGMFKGDGPFATLEKRIDAAHDRKLIDDVTHADAHLVRRIRNEFAHEKEKLHFNNSKIAALAKQLSTYEAAGSNQDAFLKAAGNVSDQATKAVKALREKPVQAEPKAH